jgi:hypothetical protein
MVSMTNASPSVPSTRVSDNNAGREDVRTNNSYDLHFLAELVLESTGDPTTILTNEGGATDAREHVAGGHDQRHENGANGPGPAALENGRDEAEGDGKGQKARPKGGPARPVERLRVRDGDRGVVRKVLRERLGLKSTALHQ